MPRFTYVAVDADGGQRTGGIDARDERAARAALQKRKLAPVRVSLAETADRSGPADPRGKGPAAEPAAAKGGLRLSHRMQLLLSRQLSTLIEAALPVDEALGMIAAQQEQPRARRVMADVQAGVVEGQRLADAMGRHPQTFSVLYRSAVAGGERAGKLGYVLTRLADYQQRSEALRAKITTALIYPAVLSLVAVLVIACLMIFVVPSLTTQFRTFNAELPAITQVLIAVSGFLAAFWPLVLLALLGLVLLARALLRREGVRLACDRALLGAPVIGRWARAVNASRFARAVATLVASGLPVLDSVRAARGGIGNLWVRGAVGRMAGWIEEGEPLSGAMRRSGVIPPLVVYMTASGENAGELAGMLDKAAEYIDQEFESFSARALSLLEPAIIIVMGLVVATIILAIMLPILQLNRLALT